MIQTLDLLGSHGGRFEDFLVQDEVYLPVEHYLLGHTTATPASDATDPSQGDNLSRVPQGVPLYDLKHITKIESHPQALGQCSTFLNKYCKHAELSETSSTSKAAQNAKADSTGRTAAVASKLCAELTGLTILAKAIQKDNNNVTRFLILRRRVDVLKKETNDTAGLESTSSDSFRTLVVFTVSHREPGALANALAVFKKHDINLTGMHTRPSGEGMWEYLFFVDFEGRRQAQGEGAVDRALADLEGVVSRIRWLGSWTDQGGRR